MRRGISEPEHICWLCSGEVSRRAEGGEQEAEGDNGPTQDADSKDPGDARQDRMLLEVLQLRSIDIIIQLGSEFICI